MTTPLRFAVAPHSGVPIYRQVMDQVRAQVAGGRLHPGDYLPSVRQLAAELQVNPMTISKAYSLLEREGVLEHDRGLGMRIAVGVPVSSPKAHRDALTPLAQQVADTAWRLGVSPRQLLKQLQQHFGESTHERRPARTR